LSGDLSRDHLLNVIGAVHSDIMNIEVQI